MSFWTLVANTHPKLLNLASSVSIPLSWRVDLEQFAKAESVQDSSRFS